MRGIFADGSEARFTCRHRHTNNIEFEINEMPPNDTLAENANITAFSTDHNGRSLFILTFKATQVLDESVIVCIAMFSDDCNMLNTQSTPPVLLLVQGTCVHKDVGVIMTLEYRFLEFYLL